MAVKKSKKAVKKTVKALPPARRKRSDAALVSRDRATKATAAAIRRHMIAAALNASDDLTTSLTDVLSGLIKGDNSQFSIEKVGLQALGILGKAGAARAAVVAARRYV